jgi:hypothetical protein
MGKWSQALAKQLWKDTRLMAEHSQGQEKHVPIWYRNDGIS